MKKLAVTVLALGSLGVLLSGGRPAARQTADCSAALPDGRVLVTAGVPSSAGTTNSAEVYDPATNAWTIVGAMGSARVT